MGATLVTHHLKLILTWKWNGWKTSNFLQSDSGFLVESAWSRRLPAGYRNIRAKCAKFRSKLRNHFSLDTSGLVLAYPTEQSLWVISAWALESENMSYLLKKLTTKREVDDVIRTTEDLVLVLRFGRDTDAVCLQHDDIVSRSER